MPDERAPPAGAGVTDPPRVCVPYEARKAGGVASKMPFVLARHRGSAALHWAYAAGDTAFVEPQGAVCVCRLCECSLSELRGDLPGHQAICTCS